MYYGNGNYEAFARPRKPKGVEEKSAYIVGAGIASLATAAFLIRDGHMDGSRITILEASKLPGGALDGIKHPSGGFMVRGDREQSNHMECLWDLMRSIPSLEVEGASVLDEFYWLQKDDPHRSLRRMTQNRGEAVPTDGKYTLSSQARREINLLSITRDEDLYDKKMNEVLGKDFFDSNFWVYWRTMFDFYEWHSALEMKRYLLRFIHHIDGQADLSAVMYSTYNQYESFTLPLVAWLKQHGVAIQYETKVTNVEFNINPDRKVARRIDWIRRGQPGGLDLTENNLVFVTNGSLVENSTWGDHHTPATFDPVIRDGNIWALWRNIARQDPAFGTPDKFCKQPDKTVLTSASLTTLDDKIPPYIQKITQRDPFAFNGRQVSGGLSTFGDSGWVMSWNCERQPHFKAQPRNQIVVWISGQLDDLPGDFVKKPMRECTGEEITREWLYHLGVPSEQIPEIAAKSAICLPCVMPFCTAFFVPRTDFDRPAVVPEHAVNFAFIGQFAETERDTIFTTEYSVRTAMEAVYTLLNVERAVPEVWGSMYDIRCWLKSVAASRDYEKLELPGLLMEVLDRTDIGGVLRKYGVV